MLPLDEFVDLISQIKEAKKKLEYAVTQGHAIDFASYRSFIGQIQGLQAAIVICEKFLNNFER